ncbi:NCS2 family permease [Mastigocoleus testarum]|uniref:Guanine permease n=1 Tax=Mastigocoleus testarum BC008 TaxID=371196 RepID=A0A0V7ZN58_9CYAN|nr:NCS2 family permease [Mastigocoleus testarum]KST65889.1 guanine permease [Mastigocoleus testarum BC008]
MKNFNYLRFQVRNIKIFFKFEDLGTNYPTEILAGITTFITLAYTLVVTPNILSHAIFLSQPGDLFEQLVFATAIVSCISTIFVGCLANYPFALAPGMGLNSLFAFSIVLDLRLDWRLALLAVFIQGLLLIVLSLSNFRNYLIEAIPVSLKHATVAGIGLFIAYIAVSGNPEPPILGAGLIVSSEATKTALGSLKHPVTLTAIFGVILTIALTVRRIKGGMLWGVLLTALLGWILGVARWPQGIIALPNWPVDLFCQALTGFKYFTPKQIGNFIAAIFILLFVTLFDSIGAMVGLGQQAGITEGDGELPRSGRTIFALAVGTIIGSLVGISPVAPYLESAAGISEGGRSGFSSLVVAVLMLLSILFIPLLSAVPSFAIAPVLILVGVLMFGKSVRAINWDAQADAISAFLVILMMPITFSLADGLAVGFIFYPLIKAFQGKAKELKLPLVLISTFSLLYFVLITIQKT